MSKFLKQSALAAAALLVAGAAQATVITFDGPSVDYTFAPYAQDMGFMFDGDTLIQNGIAVIGFDNNNAGGQPDGAGVGTLINGADVANTCYAVQCPTNDSTTFYTSLNDGVVVLTSVADNELVKLNSLQVSFVGAQGDYLGSTPGLFGIQAFYGTGADDYDFIYAALPGPSGGKLSFSNFSLAGTALDGKSYQAIYLFGFYCDQTTGGCNAFTSNKGQFAVDDINIDTIAAVPEPGEWALMAAGLGVIGGIARRRRAA